MDRHDRCQLKALAPVSANGEPTGHRGLPAIAVNIRGPVRSRVLKGEQTTGCQPLLHASGRPADCEPRPAYVYRRDDHGSVTVVW